MTTIKPQQLTTTSDREPETQDIFVPKYFSLLLDTLQSLQVVWLRMGLVIVYKLYIICPMLKLYSLPSKYVFLSFDSRGYIPPYHLYAKQELFITFCIYNYIYIIYIYIYIISMFVSEFNRWLFY